MQITLLTLLAAQSALAFPMVKRQSVIVSDITSVVQATITQAASSAASGVLSATAVASEAISSAQSMASMMPSAIPAVSSMASSAAASSAAPSFFPGYFAFPCPTGYELAYVEQQMNVNASLADTLSAVSNFTTSGLFTISNTTGDNTPGSTRTVMIESAMANEVLTNYTQNMDTMAIYETWNSTAPVTVNGLNVASYSTEQQTYINDTETSASSPVSTIKLFSNICASSATEAETFFNSFFMGAIQNGTMAITSGAVPSGSPSSAMSSAMAMPSSALSSASMQASSILSSASQAASSAVAPIANSASSAASSASAQATQAASGGALAVQTPASIVQCQPASINFNGGTAPYFLSVLPGGQATATPLLQFAQQSVAGSYVWLVNIASGTSVTLQVRDGTGAVNFSSPITILPSSDSSCLAA